MDKILQEEARFQRIADSAKVAQRSVEQIARLLNAVLVKVLNNETIDIVYYRECLALIPHLRRIDIGDGKSTYYMMDIPMPQSPLEEERDKQELAYLRNIHNAKFNIRWPSGDATMFVDSLYKNPLRCLDCGCYFTDNACPKCKGSKHEES